MKIKSFLAHFIYRNCDNCNMYYREHLHSLFVCYFSPLPSLFFLLSLVKMACTLLFSMLYITHLSRKAFEPDKNWYLKFKSILLLALKFIDTIIFVHIKSNVFDTVWIFPLLKNDSLIIMLSSFSTQFIISTYKSSILLQMLKYYQVPGWFVS